MASPNFVVCTRNAGYEASLDRGKHYRLLPDADAARHHQLRIIDESGEDYLYPKSCFSIPDALTICCADIGSVRKGRFGWASLSIEPDAQESCGSQYQSVFRSCRREAHGRKEGRARLRVSAVGTDR